MTVIYEVHVRGFTIHPTSGIEHPGTYRGLTEKIPYLKTLGVTAVELMPVQEFDSTSARRTNPQTSQPLTNYWGYDPVVFRARKPPIAVPAVWVSRSWNSRKWSRPVTARASK